MNTVNTHRSTVVFTRLLAAWLTALLLGAGAITVLPVVPALAAGSGTWALTGSMHSGRADHTATLLQNGQVLVAGGFSDANFSVALASAELFNPATGKWKTTGSMNTARIGQKATLLQNGQVLVAGGYNQVDFPANPVPLASAELFNPATGKWTTTGSMHSARIDYTATLLSNGQVLVAGGVDASGHELTSAELYNPATGAWATTGSLHVGRDSHTATLLSNGQVLVAGGVTDSVAAGITSAELYNPVTGTWTATGSLHSGRYVHTATLLQSGQVLVAGGVGTSGLPLASAELFTP